MDDVCRTALDHMMRMELRGVEVYAHHGVFDHEKRDGQVFLIDVIWWADVAEAVQTDDLRKTTDYSAVADRVVSVVQGESLDLIETVADRLCDVVLSEFPMEHAQVRVHKPHAPLSVGFDDVVCASPIRSRPCQVRTAVFSIGSNIEPRWEYLQFAVSALVATPGFFNTGVSPVYETTAVGELAQADFLNAVVAVQTGMSAHALLQRGLHVESLANRVRDVPHGPRTLDVDLIAVGDESCSDEELILPHPRAYERAFVLVPWLDLDPVAQLKGALVRDLLNAPSLADQQVHRLPDQLFLPVK